MNNFFIALLFIANISTSELSLREGISSLTTSERAEKPISKLTVAELARLRPSKIRNIIETGQIKKLKSIHGAKLHGALKKWATSYYIPHQISSLANGCFHNFYREIAVNSGKISVDRDLSIIAIANKVYKLGLNGLSQVNAIMQPEASSAFDFVDEDLPEYVNLFEDNHIVNFNNFSVSPDANLIVGTATVHGREGAYNTSISFEPSTASREHWLEVSSIYEDIYPDSGANIGANNDLIYYSSLVPDSSFLTSSIVWDNCDFLYYNKVISIGDRHFWSVSQDKKFILHSSIFSEDQTAQVNPNLIEHISQEVGGIFTNFGINIPEGYELIAHTDSSKANNLICILKNEENKRLIFSNYIQFNEAPIVCQLILNNFLPEYIIGKAQHIAASEVPRKIAIATEDEAPIVIVVNTQNMANLEFRMGLGEKIQKIVINKHGNKMLIHYQKPDGKNYIIQRDI